MSSQPRVPPLGEADRDERTDELLRSLRRHPDDDDLNIFATLAHHPRLLRRWSQFGGMLLYGGALPARARELLILRTAHNCRAHYEWAQHVRIGRAVGIVDAEIERLASPGLDGWSDEDRALLAAADELHREARVRDTTWQALAEQLDAAQLIEVCMVVGQYHLVAFTLNSLGVELEADLADDTAP